MIQLELIDAIPEDENVTLYTQGEFTDLCRGVHVPSTSKIKNLSYYPLLALIGVVIVITRCYNVFTVLHFSIKRSKSALTNA